jgi:GMP synthase (glutamine-hydrolysing)
MRILEFSHDADLPVFTNVNTWVARRNYNLTRVNLWREDPLPVDPDAYDLFVLHGGVRHLWDEDDRKTFLNEIQFIRSGLTQRIPVVGFCLGAQLLAEALDERTYQSTTPEIGWYHIEPTLAGRAHPVLAGLEDGFETFLWHHDHFPLPCGAISLASTPGAENQVFIHPDKKFVAYQFHPEYIREDILAYCAEHRTSWEQVLPAASQQLESMSTRMPETYPLFEKLIDNAVNWMR